MPEVTVDKKKGTITIVLPLQKPERSASGKTMVIATTRGNIQPGETYEGKPITIGVNVYFKP